MTSHRYQKQPAWTGPDELLDRLRRRWEAGEFLAALASQTPWEPLTVPLRAPTAAELADHFGAAQDWISQWRQIDPGLVRLKYKTIGGRRIGSNDVPHHAVIEHPHQLWTLLGVTAQVETFRRLLDTTRGAAPALTAWMAAHPMKVLAHENSWPSLVDTVRWIDRQQRPGMYLRQVDVPGVDTKFIEQHYRLLAALLDRQLAPDRVDPAYPPRRFAERYKFRTKPVYVRLRTLDQTPPTSAPYREMTLRVDELAATPIAAARVIVVENEITYLALPPVADAIAVFGGGYALPVLRPLQWLHERELLYWGDIDTHGFAILDRLRQIFPHTRSILMDHETLLGHRSHWTREPIPAKAALSHLNQAEAGLYTDLVTDRFGPSIRLEQERVRLGAVQDALGGG